MGDLSDKQLQMELGGSVFELIEFSLTRMIRGKPVKGVYGVNVAKVREVVRMPPINPLSSRVKGVAGVFELRGIPIPAVNLAVALGDDHAEPLASQQIIVTEFSQKRAGFIVDSTRRIRRVAWDKVMPPSADAGTCINGMTLIEQNNFLFILDLERVLIMLEFGDAPPTSQGSASRERESYTDGKQSGRGKRVLLVDDSKFIRNGVSQVLLREGYHVTEAGDGAEALAALDRSLGTAQRFDIMVSDVEMPRMDGLTLTRKVREHPGLSTLPIVLHTSLSGRSNQAAGMSIGANGYVVKNDMLTLLAMMTEVMESSEHALSA